MSEALKGLLALFYQGSIYGMVVLNMLMDIFSRKKPHKLRKYQYILLLALVLVNVGVLAATVAYDWSVWHRLRGGMAAAIVIILLIFTAPSVYTLIRLRRVFREARDLPPAA